MNLEQLQKLMNILNPEKLSVYVKIEDKLYPIVGVHPTTSAYPWSKYKFILDTGIVNLKDEK